MGDANKMSGRMMGFPDAMQVVKAGGRVRRVSWDNKEWAGLRNGNLCILKEDGLLHQWLVNDGDIMGEDWVTLAD